MYCPSDDSNEYIKIIPELDLSLNDDGEECMTNISDKRSTLSSVSDIENPVIITRRPRFRNNKIIVNLWRNLIVDVDVSRRYCAAVLDDELLEQSQHTMVLCLLTWGELEKYDAIRYPLNVQQSGKKFIHFPLHKSTHCRHTYIPKAQCYEGSCGRLAPFLDMRAMTSMINSYMDNGEKILIYSHKDQNRTLLFMACCMAQGGIQLNDILSIMDFLKLRERYRSYIKHYMTYIREIN